MSLSILLIEADSARRRDLALVLETTGGYRVTALPSAEKAVPLLLSAHFDLVVGQSRVLAQMPVDLHKIGYGPRPDIPPPSCLGWVDKLAPLPAFAEQVRQLYARRG